MSDNRDAYWSQDYRGFAVIASAVAEPGGGYKALFKIDRPGPDGRPQTLVDTACDGRHASEGAAREAASDAAQAWIEQLLAGSGG